MNPLFDDDVLEEEKTKEKVKEPGMFSVILHNDNYTTFEYVIFILRSVFNKNQIDAEKITNDIHTKDKGIVGIYPLDIAKTKVEQVNKLAERDKFPLKCTMEKK